MVKWHHRRGLHNLSVEEGMKVEKEKTANTEAGVSTSEGAHEIKAVIKDYNFSKWFLAVSGAQHVCSFQGVCVFKESEFSLDLYRK